MMYDNLQNRLRAEAKVSDASPYIKELMKNAADALDHFENLTRKLQSLSKAPTIIKAFQQPYKSNGDRVRAMTDEELAKFFENITFCDYCFIIKNEYETERYPCEQRWIDWLKQEVDDRAFKTAPDLEELVAYMDSAYKVLTWGDENGDV